MSASASRRNTGRTNTGRASTGRTNTDRTNTDRTNADRTNTGQGRDRKPSHGGRWFWRFYTVSWTAMAAAALGYVVALETSPDVVNAWLPLAGSTVRQVADAGPTTNDTEIAALKQSVAGVRTQVAKVRSEIAARDARLIEAIEDLRSRAEQALPIARRSAADVGAVIQPSGALEPSGQATTLPTALAPTSVTAPVTARVANGRQPPLPVRTPRANRQVAAIQPSSGAISLPGLVLINPDAFEAEPQPQAARVTTGSIPRQEPPAVAAPIQAEPQRRTVAVSQPVSFGVPEVTVAAPRQVAIRLSNGPSLDAIRLSWRVLNERHGSVLQALEPRYRTTGAVGSGSPFQLIAGPMASRDEADRVCGLLIAKGVVCSLDEFGGNAL